jgi:acyl-coenzyme A synthetase/AMP-(fatty) acid ligase
MEEIQDSIVKSLKKNAIMFLKKTAFIFKDVNDVFETKISYGELHNKVEALANQLQIRSLNQKSDYL